MYGAVHTNNVRDRAMHVIGILETSTADPIRRQLWETFRQSLRALGYVEGRDIRFEARWAEGNPARLAEFAAELVGLKVDAIVTAGTPAAFAARRATAAIPIVTATGVSVDAGLGEGPANSGGNVTGLSDLVPGLSAIRLELLTRVVPAASLLAVLLDRTNPAGTLVVGEYEDAAGTLGLALKVYGVNGPNDFNAALSAMVRVRAGGFIGVTSAMFFGERKRIAALALEHRLPAMFVRREYAEAGGLMAYGAPIGGNYRRAAGYVDKILRGASPAELPVQQPIDFELVINAKTACALGVSIPPDMLAAAQQVDTL